MQLPELARWCLTAGVAVLSAGCGSDSPQTAPPYPAPAAVQIGAAQAVAEGHRSAEIRSRRSSVLLDFETAHDLAFIRPESPIMAAIDANHARGGARSLKIAPGSGAISIKLPTLLHGRPFPADWTLLVAYLYCDRPIAAAASVDMPPQRMLSQTVTLVPNAWTPVMLEVTSGNLGTAGGESKGSGELRFTFGGLTGGDAATVWMDDLLLIDNHETLIDTTAGAGNERPWSVRRRGLNYIVDMSAAGRSAFALPSALAAEGGWEPIEVGALRVRFSSAAEPRTMTVYADGRIYWGDAFQPGMANPADAEALAAQHASPAELRVPAVMGRVNRSSDGDADNDGYNEARGAYQLVAAGARLEVAITPRTDGLIEPVLEVAGLPPGRPRVTMEGRLLSEVARLSNGDLLVVLPGRLQRSTLVNISIP